MGTGIRCYNMIAPSLNSKVKKGKNSKRLGRENRAGFS